jgi:hypothetical protein
MDDVLENAFMNLANHIQNAYHAKVEVILPSTLEKSTYLYPDYIIRFKCRKETASFVVDAVVRYCNERFRQPGVQIILKKNGKEIDLLRAPNLALI